MKHATTEALDRLEPLLARLRRHGELREKSRGVFYRRSRAALHFHEDPGGLFADLRTDGDWRRFCVDTERERSNLLRAVAAWLAR
jgi:hypothetical protein